MTLTELRRNIYRVVDELLRTGKTMEIQAKGRTVYLSSGQRGGKLDRLRKAARSRALQGNPEDIIHMEWEKQWHPRHIWMLL